MLICKKFVLLNNPKTGSTFVRTVIKEIYKKKFFKSCKEIILDFQRSNRYIKYSQHGGYYQIPKKYLNRTVVSVIRNPYEKFLSTYEFRWWVTVPPIAKESVPIYFPQFPDLSIDDFVYMNELSAEYALKHNPLSIGTQTIHFIYMFFKDPEKILAQLTPEYLESNTLYKKDLADIIFLKQENLNAELSNFLLSKGFSKKDAEFCNKRARVNKTNQLYENRTGLWTKKAIDYVTYQERFLLKILKDLGIEYLPPTI